MKTAITVKDAILDEKVEILRDISQNVNVLFMEKEIRNERHILMLHSQLIEQTGGTTGVRDFNLLKAAIETPFQAFGGEELYPTIQAKGTRLGYGLIKNHCIRV